MNADQLAALKSYIKAVAKDAAAERLGDDRLYIGQEVREAEEILDQSIEVERYPHG